MVISILMFFCGFALCSMICVTARVTLEDTITQYKERDDILKAYIQILRTGDLELTKEEMLDSIEKVLQGSDENDK